MEHTFSEYFLGEATPSGFKTDFFHELKKQGIYSYILKGGPGTGKSGLMRKIADTFKDSDDVEYYHCSSDPDSLDAIILKNSKIAVLDGTSPHTYDPQYAGISDCIINLGEFWNSQKLLSEKERIIRSADKCSSLHLRARGILSALSAVNNDIYTQAKSFIMMNKFNAFSERMLKKFIPKKSDNTGKISYKKISAFTKDGYITLLPKDYKIILADDPYFYGSSELMHKIYSRACEYGYSCNLSMFNLLNTTVIEHIMIEDLGLIFMTKNEINKISPEGEIISKINFKRFYNKEKLKENKFKLDFNKKIAHELLNEAIQSVQDAKKEHDILEKYYINAVDFKKLDKKASEMIKKISENYK